MSGKLVAAELADKPGNSCNRSGRKNQPPSSPKGARGERVEGVADSAGARELDGFERIDEAQQDEKDGNSGIPLPDEAEIRKLEKARFARLNNNLGHYPSREA